LENRDVLRFGKRRTVHEQLDAQRLFIMWQNRKERQNVVLKVTDEAQVRANQKPICHDGTKSESGTSSRTERATTYSCYAEVETHPRQMQA
jgi:hypothetical protein